MKIGHWFRGIKRLFVKRSLVLMYHRIADTAVDPWQLSVSKDHFEEHLQVLKSSFQVVKAGDLVSQVIKKTVPKNNICLTFDDGYRDNYDAARPLLEKFKCPATFFIATGYAGVEQQFWWDELTEIFLLLEKLPPVLSISINRELLEFNLRNDGKLHPDELNVHKLWLWPQEPPTQRCKIYLAIWERLKPLPFVEIQAVLSQLKQWAGSDCAKNDHFPMKSNQLKELFQHPFIDIGIHTVTHPALAFHSSIVQRNEIFMAKQYLEENSGSLMHLIAYPYGNYNDLTLNIVQELNLSGGFTTSENAVHDKTDPYQIGRFQVKNWGGQQFMLQLLKWLKGF